MSKSMTNQVQIYIENMKKKTFYFVLSIFFLIIALHHKPFFLSDEVVPSLSCLPIYFHPKTNYIKCFLITISFTQIMGVEQKHILMNHSKIFKPLLTTHDKVLLHILCYISFQLKLQQPNNKTKTVI